jgi:hypothetical protein
MRRYTHPPWAAALTLAVALVPGLASAQEADTLSISGTFLAEGLEYPGIIGVDLAEVLSNGNEHGWTLTLQGVTYSHEIGIHFPQVTPTCSVGAWKTILER